jgi:hypothetical protein
VPVEFLTDEQRRRYGRFHRELASEDLSRYFHLDDSDHSLIALHRGNHNRLGFAVQLCTARYLSAFPEDLTETPAAVVSVLGRQLGIEDSNCFTQYCASRQRWDHTVKIRERGGYVDFSDGSIQFQLFRWLYALCWTGTDQPSMLFDRATTWLITHKVLLPGATVLERHVSRIRVRVQERLWSSLVRGVSPAAKQKLDELLAVPDGGHQSLLDRLRNGPFRRSAPELIRALQRLEEVRRLGIDVGVSQRIPPGRVQALARFATTAKASAIQRLPEERRLATLVAFAVTLEATASDDALDLLDILITEAFSDATKAGEKARLRTIKDLDVAASQLGLVCHLVLDCTVADAELRSAIFKALQREDLEAALFQVDALVRPPDDLYYQELLKSWRRIRRIIPPFLKTLHFGSTPAGKAIGEALESLAGQDKLGELHGVPPEVVTRGWRGYVFDKDGTVDSKAYVFCCLDRLRSALRRRDLFVAPSVRYADARIGLLSGAAWETSRSTICRSLGHSLSAGETITGLGRQLDQAYRTVAANLPANPSARVEMSDGKEELVLTALDKLDVPPSLVRLREVVNSRLPRVDLPEILLEIAGRTGFTSKFTHVTERDSRAGDLATSLCAVLIAEACNIGMEPLIRNDVPALRRSRLSWVNQNFIRNETLTEANTCLSPHRIA